MQPPARPALDQPPCTDTCTWPPSLAVAASPFCIPSSVQTSLAWPWLWIFALSLRVFAFVFCSVSPLSHRHHDVHRGQPPLRCQSQFRNLSRVKLRTSRARVTIQQQRPTATGRRGRLTKGICGDELTQPNIGLAILARRRKAQPAIYIYTEWAIFARECARHPRIVSISFFFPSPPFLLLLSTPPSKQTPCCNCLCWPRIYFIPTCPELLAIGFTFDSRPRLLCRRSMRPAWASSSHSRLVSRVPLLFLF